MAVSPADLAAGAAALKAFEANAKYVEMIVDIAFAVVPTLLGFGAAGLIGSAAIKTAKEVMNSISMLKTLQWYGTEQGITMARSAGRSAVKTVKRIDESRQSFAEKLKQNKYLKIIGYGLTPIETAKSLLKKKQNIQGKQNSGIIIRLDEHLKKKEGER